MRRLRRPPTSLLDKFHGNEVQALYTGTVVVTGGEAAHGRASGIARSQDGELELHLRLPKELGGDGGGTNPEQLLAAGYAACFHGALSLLAARRGLAAVTGDRSTVIRSMTDSDGIDVVAMRTFSPLSDVDSAIVSLCRRLRRSTIEKNPSTRGARPSKPARNSVI